MKVIYDVGADDGGDIEYYLMKADKVVSIDANPYAIDNLRKNFHQELVTGRLALIHCAVGSCPGEVTFHVNKNESGLSRRRVVDYEVAHLGDKCSDDAWELVTVPSARISDIIRDQGEPYFIKLDIEGDESIVMQDLYSARIHPPYISTELGWSFDECLRYMHLIGYRSFQIMNMNTVQHQFKQHSIKLPDGTQVRYDFTWGSCGPFGEDLLPDWWVDFERLGVLVATRNLIFGDDPNHWYDVHARLPS